MTHLLDDLAWRDLIADTTDLGALRVAMDESPITVYVGFDPTAPSLHHGNLLQLITLKRFQLAGHRPLGLVGGSTGLIGDPGGRTSERQLNPKELVAEWVERLQSQVSRFLDFEGDNPAQLVNNLDWTEPLSAIDFLREIGKHFRVNRMLAKESVSARLNSESGISYTEFSYQILQGMDYLELFRRYGCTLQTGGSDQWGNLTAGVDLIRRVEGAHVHALATKLITKADGTKFGKTAGGAVWLDADMFSPYAFHQFWLGADDRDIAGWMKAFSLRTREEIEGLIAEGEAAPHLRIPQRALADELTDLVHGSDQRHAAEDAAKALFGRGELAGIDESVLVAALQEAGIAEVAASSDEGTLPRVSFMMKETGLVPSLGEARRTIKEGGAYLNNVRVEDPEQRLEDGDLLHGSLVVLRRGKRTVAGARVR
ncbi:tyrosyl-tRNA synthetase [Antricoccus suffuscus]|uniref:Tyrosine--tRNA ligase n=1 Tax=Antricoccus suffuscus TaxID=1629062 RepID=A0A2T0ZWF3_9ACTN|nr:tyrosine--tRNA ligase [Antricoccus suffuscus]PRZ40691.1 tyrosyl-tRNA synthetase [Antricoccus suffuscus]